MISDREYLKGGVAFLALAVPWTVRNVVTNGHPETQPYATQSLLAWLHAGLPYSFGLARVFGVLTLQALIVLVIVFAIYLRVPLSARNTETVRPREPKPGERSLLVMGYLLASVSALCMAGSFILSEGSPLLDTSTSRYVIPSIPLLAWAVISFSRRVATEWHALSAGMMSFALVVVSATSPLYWHDPNEEAHVAAIREAFHGSRGILVQGDPGSLVYVGLPVVEPGQAYDTVSLPRGVTTCPDGWHTTGSWANAPTEPHFTICREGSP